MKTLPIILYLERLISVLYIPKSFPSSGMFLDGPLLHLRHSSADLMAMKLSLHLMKLMASLYFSPVLSESFSARALWKMMLSGPIHPVVVKTNGVKVPCSTCITLWL